MEYEAPATLSMAEAVARLAAAGIAAPQREARLLLSHALGRAPETMLGERVPPPSGFASLIARRAAREPLAFILERREFWSLPFAVSPATLIPRPETETLLEAALAALPRRAAVQRVLDLGTGTGCLLLAALTEFPAAFGVGVDLVAEAALLARRNAEALGLASRAAFLVGDWAAALVSCPRSSSHFATNEEDQQVTENKEQASRYRPHSDATDFAIGTRAGTFDLILANPPYIERATIPGLMPEVARFEPRSALDGGYDGLDAYRQLLPSLSRLLAPGGLAILELGAGGADRVARLAEREGLAIRALKPDLQGNSRALVLASRGPKKPFGSEG